MKKSLKILFISGMIILFLIFIYFIMSFIKKENVIKNVEISISKSTIYSKKEIKSAMNVVKDEVKDWPIDLTSLWYDETKSLQESKELAGTYNVDEVLILYSNFKTQTDAMYLGFNPDSEYTNFNWILVRNNKGNWQLKDKGY